MRLSLGLSFLLPLLLLLASVRGLTDIPPRGFGSAEMTFPVVTAGIGPQVVEVQPLKGGERGDLQVVGPGVGPQVTEVHGPATNGQNGKEEESSKVRFGNYYNYWLFDPSTNTFDLTRGGSPNAVTVQTITKGNSSITFAPERSALVIIDMQNFFLHPELAPKSDLGRAAVAPTLAMIDAFRSRGMKIAWVNWGITPYDLTRTLSPSFLYNFSKDKTKVGMATSLCTEMGPVKDAEVDMAGKKLCRGSWNAQNYGPLHTSWLKGKEMGTDFWFDKNTPSGLWGVMTPLEMWLRDEGITTMFFGGVNTDQCVYGTMLDSSYKGYDTVMVQDMCATTSPEFATQMVVYNMDRRGWVTNTSLMLPKLT